MENLFFYERARTVPDEALKPIQAGRLKGMSDINPMWRIKRLTEMFGPCGVGWWYDVIRKEIVYDEITKQKCAFVDISLFYVDPESGKESHAIPGTGGASFLANERNGPYLSDECYKMALTDAISVAAKALGVAADVYFANDRTKYSNPENGQQQPPQGQQQPPQQPQPQSLRQKVQQLASPGAGIPAKHSNGEWTVKSRINRFCKEHSMTMEQFGKCRDALIAGEIVPNIPADQLSPIDCENLLGAIVANFIPAIEGQAK